MEPPVAENIYRITMSSKCEAMMYCSTEKADQHIKVELKVGELDLTAADSKVAYAEINVGILARLAREEPASYVSIAMRLGGLQDYVDVWNELN